MQFTKWIMYGFGLTPANLSPKDLIPITNTLTVDGNGY